MAERRSSKRRHSSSIDSIDGIPTVVVLRSLPVGHQAQSCIEWGMPQRTCCSGCVQFADRVGLTIDDRDHDALMAEALATRPTKHKHRDKQCLQLWMKPLDTLRAKEHKRLAKLQLDFISKRGFDASEIQATITPASTVIRPLPTAQQRDTPRLPIFRNPPWQSPTATSTANPSTANPSTVNPSVRTISPDEAMFATATSTATAMSTATATSTTTPNATSTPTPNATSNPNATSTPSATLPTATLPTDSTDHDGPTTTHTSTFTASVATTSNNDDDDDDDDGPTNAEDTAVITTPAKKRRKTHMHTQTFTSYNEKFSITLPKSHVIIHSSQYKQLLQAKDTIAMLRIRLRKKRFARNAAAIIKAYLAVTLAACPGFSITALGYVIPLFVVGFLHLYDLFDHVSSYEFFAHNFPSETYLRERITEQATHDMVYLSHELKEKLVFLSCDKGKSTVLKFW